MVKPGSYLSGLIPAVLLFQTLLAPALCRDVLSRRVDIITICTAHGLQTVPLPADDPQPSDHARDAFCPALASLAVTPPLAFPALPAPRWAVTGPAWIAVPAERFAEPARAPPFRSTGPPVFAS